MLAMPRCRDAVQELRKCDQCIAVASDGVPDAGAGYPLINAVLGMLVVNHGSECKLIEDLIGSNGGLIGSKRI